MLGTGRAKFSFSLRKTHPKKSGTAHGLCHGKAIPGNSRECRKTREDLFHGLYDSALRKGTRRLPARERGSGLASARGATSQAERHSRANQCAPRDQIARRNRFLETSD